MIDATKLVMGYVFFAFLALPSALQASNGSSIGVSYNNQCNTYVHKTTMAKNIETLKKKIRTPEDASEQAMAAAEIANTFKNCDPDLSASYSIKTIQLIEKQELLRGIPLPGDHCGRGESLIEALNKAGRFHEAEIWMARTYHQCRKHGEGLGVHMAMIALMHHNETRDKRQRAFYASEISKLCEKSTSDLCRRAMILVEVTRPTESRN